MCFLVKTLIDSQSIDLLSLIIVLYIQRRGIMPSRNDVSRMVTYEKLDRDGKNLLEYARFAIVFVDGNHNSLTMDSAARMDCHMPS